MEATISHIRRVLFFMGSSAFGVSENGNYVDCSGQMKRAKSRGATDLLYSVTISYKRLISARIRNVGGNGRSIPSEPSMGHHTRQRVASRKEQEFLGILAPTRAANCASVPSTGRYCPTCASASIPSPDAHLQLISGHKTKRSLEVYQHLSLQAVESAYQEAVHSLNI